MKKEKTSKEMTEKALNKIEIGSYEAAIPYALLAIALAIKESREKHPEETEEKMKDFLMIFSKDS